MSVIGDIINAFNIHCGVYMVYTFNNEISNYRIRFSLKEIKILPSHMYLGRKSFPLSRCYIKNV